MQYFLLTEIKTKAREARWWMEPTDNVQTLQIFDSFEEAKAEMRQTVKRVAESCAFFPFGNGKYAPVEEYNKDVRGDGNIEKLSEVIRGTIRNADYVCEEDFNVYDVEDYEWLWAFVGNKDLIAACYCGKTLRTNVHRMTGADKPYYFSYAENDMDGRVVNAVSVRLFYDVGPK